MRNIFLAIVLAVSAAAGAKESGFATATIQVKGMTCGSCAVAVKHALQQIDGVREASVSYQTGQAVVSYDPAKITPDAIARATEKKLPGYKFEPATASANRSDNQNVHTAVKTVAVISPTHVAASRLSFYEIGLVCPAAPKIGCGGRSKPVLLALISDPRIEGAWLNEAGTQLAIGWKSANALSPDQVDQIISSFALSVHEISDHRPTLIESLHSERGWFDAVSIDRLSEHEAEIIAARLVRRLVASTSIPQAEQIVLRDGMARALRANFIEGDQRDLDEQLVAVAKEAKLDRGELAKLREVVALGIYPLTNEQ